MSTKKGITPMNNPLSLVLLINQLYVGKNE